MRLTEEQVLRIPKLIQEMTQANVAKELGVHQQTVAYWIRRFKRAGTVRAQKRGPRPLNLTK